MCFFLNTNCTNRTNMASRCALAAGYAECTRPGGKAHASLRCVLCANLGTSSTANDQ